MFCCQFCLYMWVCALVWASLCVCVSCSYCSLLWRVLCFCHCITTGALLTSTPFVRAAFVPALFSFFLFSLFLSWAGKKRSILIQTSSVSFDSIQLSLASGSAHPSPSWRQARGRSSWSCRCNKSRKSTAGTHCVAPPRIPSPTRPLGRFRTCDLLSLPWALRPIRTSAPLDNTWTTYSASWEASDC